MLSAGNNQHPAWSPDGQRIAFACYRDGQFEIYLLNADGSESRILTTHPAEDTQPAWIAPNLRFAFLENRLLFTTNRDRQREIYLIHIGGSMAVNLSTHPANDYTTHGSPNGQHILFTSDRSGNQDVWKMGADGSRQTELTNHPAQDQYPAWR
jgi:TolB protein